MKRRESEFSLISIHALRKESDTRSSRERRSPTNISIHALRKESDQTSRIQVVNVL